MKYINADEQKPPQQKYIFGLLRFEEDQACICKWFGSSWGAHISISKWRHLTDKEWIKLDRGEIKPYTRLKGSVKEITQRS